MVNCAPIRVCKFISGVLWKTPMRPGLGDEAFVHLNRIQTLSFEGAVNSRTIAACGNREPRFNSRAAFHCQEVTEQGLCSAQCTDLFASGIRDETKTDQDENKMVGMNIALRDLARIVPPHEDFERPNNSGGGNENKSSTVRCRGISTLTNSTRATPDNPAPLPPE